MGYIVVIEGTDGCGKQTQSKALYQKLLDLGLNARIQSFPNYDSPSAAPVKMYLGGEFGSDTSMDAYQASALYAVDRLCTYMKDLKEFYENGGIIVMDRYVQSNMLHQACKIGDRNEVDKYLDWLDKLEFGDFKLPRPNRVIFLDVPIEVSTKLKKIDSSIKELKEFKESIVSEKEQMLSENEKYKKSLKADFDKKLAEIRAETDEKVNQIKKNTIISVVGVGVVSLILFIVAMIV